jgi:hypothetical protein
MGLFEKGNVKRIDGIIRAPVAASPSIIGLSRGLNLAARSVAGFSLVEALVAGVLIMLSVVAVVAVINTGSLFETNDNDYRQARAVIRSVFEQQYNFRDYNTIPESATTSETAVIDERQGNALNGTLTTRIAKDSVATTGGVKVQFKRISITCAWQGADGANDSVTLVKTVTKAQ